MQTRIARRLQPARPCTAMRASVWKRRVRPVSRGPVRPASTVIRALAASRKARPRRSRRHSAASSVRRLARLAFGCAAARRIAASSPTKMRAFLAALAVDATAPEAAWFPDSLSLPSLYVARLRSRRRLHKTKSPTHLAWGFLLSALSGRRLFFSRRWRCRACVEARDTLRLRCKSAAREGDPSAGRSSLPRGSHARWRSRPQGRSRG
jgi:hypothetical protein